MTVAVVLYLVFQSSRPLAAREPQSDSLHNLASPIIITNASYPGAMSDPTVPPLVGQGCDFKQVGILKPLTKTRDILPLMGRVRQQRQDTWFYYTFKDGNTLVKLPIFYKKKDCTGEYGCDRLSTKDTVFVEGYAEPYQVVMYNSSCFNYLG
jgi:hypothetical protein